MIRELWPLVIVALWLWMFLTLWQLVYEERERMTNLFKSIWGLFGRNQWIGIVFHTTTLVVACGVTYTSGEVTGVDLLGFLKWWGPAAVSSLTVPSMGVEIAKARNGGPKV